MGLHRDDVEGSHKPPPYYLKVTRMSYLWAHLDQLQDFFDYYAISIVNHEHWLEVLDSPLPWDMPFGVLIDSYTPYSLDPVAHIKHSQHRCTIIFLYIKQKIMHFNEFESIKMLSKL